jgi:predicted dehydrogenase
MKNHSINRRQFLRYAGTTALGMAALPSFAKKIAPSDKLRVVHIGVNGMGTAHMKAFAAIPEVEIVGLCDVDSTHLATAQKVLQELRPDNKAQSFADFRRILDQKDVDVITCATPDHWHAQIAIMAFQAGKDVYGEKPLSFDVREGQKMLKALNRYERIFQLGTQIHAGDNYHRVAELIQAGAIGKVKTVRLWKTGPPPVLPPLSIQPPPAHLNWDMWLGPAPFSEYAPERCHFNYRYFLDYSGGVFQDFWCHIADIVWWSIKPQNLSRIKAKGEKSEGSGDTPQWIEVEYDFDDLKLYWTSTPPPIKGAEKRHIGAYFEGEKGNLLCDYSSCEITINGITVADLPEYPLSIPRSKGHHQNFVDAVKTRTQPESNLAYARDMTLPMHLGLISYRLGGKELFWNAEKEKFRKDKAANALLSREYRKGWNLI